MPPNTKNSKDKYYEIVLHKPFTESLHHMYRFVYPSFKMKEEGLFHHFLYILIYYFFSLFRSESLESSEEKFIVFKERIPIYIKITKEVSKIYICYYIIIKYK